MSSYEDFKKDLTHLEPGERHAYHIGTLQIDRQRESTVHKKAVLVSGLNLLGLVTLSQQKLDKKQTAYYLTVSRSQARGLQDRDITRAWTVGQETLSSN